MKKTLYLGLDPSRFATNGVIVHFPLIAPKQRPLEEIKPFIKNTANYSHILFTSRTVVSFFCSLIQKKNLPNAVIVIGAATKKRVEDFGCTAHYCADFATGEGVISLFETLSWEGKSILYPHSSLSRDVISSYLLNKRISHTAFSLYDTVILEKKIPNIEQFDEIVFTSPSTVDAFFKLSSTLPPKEKCRCIGPVTLQALEEMRKKL